MVQLLFGFSYSPIPHYHCINIQQDNELYSTRGFRRTCRGLDVFGSLQDRMFGSSVGGSRPTARKQLDRHVTWETRT